MILSWFDFTRPHWENRSPARCGKRARPYLLHGVLQEDDPSKDALGVDKPARAGAVLGAWVAP